MSGVRCQVSGVSATDGDGAARLIEKVTLKKRITNNECRMSNVEGMYSVYFMKKTEQSETILRHSAVRYSTFCGSLFPADPAIETIDLLQMD